MTIPDHFADSREAVLKARELLRRAHAVIFDFDGLLVDTEYAIYSSWERVFASCGHPLPLDLFNQCLGSGYTHWNPASCPAPENSSGTWGKPEPLWEWPPVLPTAGWTAG